MSDKKRILVVSQHYWPENFRINDISMGFIDEGIEVDVLCGLPNYPKGEYFEGYSYTKPRRQEYKGVNVFRSGEIRRKGNTSLRIFLNYVSFPLYALFSLPRLAGRSYDAVFCYETSPVMMILPAIAASKIKKARLITYVLDLWPENLYSVLEVKSPFLRSIARKISDWHYRRCDKLIAVSGGMAERLGEIKPHRKKGMPEITVIPQYCEDFYADDIIDAAIMEKYSNSFNIVFTGNLSPAQDIENLIDAVAIAKKRGAAKLRCLIVGDGMSRESLEEKVRALELEGTVVFCGSCIPQDIPKWTNVASGLYLGLKSSENLGLTVPAKLQSYLAAAKPILAAVSAEAEKEAEKSGAALLSPPGNSKALAENILKLYNMSEGERGRLSCNGRKAYEQNYKRSILLQKLQNYILN